MARGGERRSQPDGGPDLFGHAAAMAERDGRRVEVWARVISRTERAVHLDDGTRQAWVPLALLDDLGPRGDGTYLPTEKGARGCWRIAQWKAIEVGFA
jgi:hypothetical protein